MKGSSTEEIEEFISSLEAALNAHDAVKYNQCFADNISWGNPNGGLLSSLGPLHAAHKTFLEGPLRDSTFSYTVERVELIASDAAYAHVRLTRTNSEGVVESDERCLYVFARRRGDWSLCAGHNTRIQPGQSAE